MIRRLDAGDIAAFEDALGRLLWDAVDSGASVGFLPPLAEAEWRAYWRQVRAAVDEGSRVVLASFDRDDVVGSVQLDLAMKANARHRAEVCRLLVRRDARRRGLGRALMLAAEDAARAMGRTLLVLDTRRGDPSESLYRGMGYTCAGKIPSYAQSADGSLHATVFFYKHVG